MSERLLRSFLAIALSLAPLSALAGLFDESTVMAVELEGPIETLIEQKRYPATRTFKLRAEGSEQPVGVRVRGKSRLQLCDFPPLSLDFGDAGGAAGGPFEGLNRLKMVTHCFDYDEGERNAVTEYAVYRMLSLLSDYGYRVRLLNIRYIDSQDGGTRVRHGFVLEPQEALAERVGGERLRVEAVSLGRFDPDNLAMVYLFQYLVGSTDWSLVTAHGDQHCCHNGDLVVVDGTWYYVPYDFDQAGLVDARYARPDPSLRIRSVRQRLYRGFCKHDQGLPGALQRVRDLQTELLAVIDGLPVLDDDDREKRREYLLAFYDDAQDPEKLLKSLRRRCLK